MFLPQHMILSIIKGRSADMIRKLFFEAILKKWLTWWSAYEHYVSADMTHEIFLEAFF